MGFHYLEPPNKVDIQSELTKHEAGFPKLPGFQAQGVGVPKGMLLLA